MQSSEVQNNAVPVEAVEPPPAVDVVGDDMDASTPSAENENSTNDTNVNPDRRLARDGARSSWSEIFYVGAGGAKPEGQRGMPERQTTMPEGQQEDREPEGQQAVNRDGVPCAAHTHVLHRAPKVPEGRTGSTWVKRATGGVRQPAAALIATSPEALKRLLERRRQEARARLLVREQARRWELWRRWA